MPLYVYANGARRVKRCTLGIEFSLVSAPNISMPCGMLGKKKKRQVCPRNISISAQDYVDSFCFHLIKRLSQNEEFRESRAETRRFAPRETPR